MRHLGPSTYIVRPFGPLPGGMAELFGEDRHSCGNPNHLVLFQFPRGLLGLVVEAGRGVDGLGGPVNRDIGQQLVLAKAASQFRIEFWR